MNDDGPSTVAIPAPKPHALPRRVWIASGAAALILAGGSTITFDALTRKHATADLTAAAQAAASDQDNNHMPPNQNGATNGNGFASGQRPQFGSGMTGQGPGPGAMPSGAIGTVAEIGESSFTVNAFDGSTYTIGITDSTRFVDANDQQVGYNTLKPGDFVRADGRRPERQ